MVRKHQTRNLEILRGATAPHSSRFASPGMTASTLSHPEKIPFADLDAVMAQNAVGDRGVEIEIREREARQELLALQRELVVRPGREGDVARVRAVELRRLVSLHIVDRPGDTLAQILKALFRVGRA